MKVQSLRASLIETFELLSQTQPIPTETDISWFGPFYIPRTGCWTPTYFRIIEMKMYAFVSVPGSSYDYGMVWDLESRQWAFHGSYSCGFGDNPEKYWIDVIAQVSRRLRAALKNLAQYNRMVEARLPISCRTGKIQRALTWSKGEKPGLTERTLRSFERLEPSARRTPPLEKVALADYLATAAIAYDAAFKNLVALSPLEKYKSRADGRHGGMLDLPEKDAKSFTQWLESRRWSGSHPWEIVRGNPHGIMLSPRRNSKTASWSYVLSVHAKGWYVSTVEMAIALAKCAVPFEFLDSARVVAILRGSDMVDVGSGLSAVSYDEIRAVRPDSLKHIQWDPIPQITLITRDQSARLRCALTAKAAPAIPRALPVRKPSIAKGKPSPVVSNKLKKDRIH